MKRKIRAVLLLILSMLASLFILTGCEIGVSLDEIISENNLVARVTYYAGYVDTSDEENQIINSGNFGEKTYTKDVYYRDNSPVLNLGTTALDSGSIEFERNDYRFIGWYEMVENPSYVEGETPETERFLTEVVNGETYYKLGNPVDFSGLRITKGEHWHFCAMWRRDLKMNVQLVCDELGANETINATIAGETVSYKNGDILKAVNYENEGYLDKLTKAPLDFPLNGTFLEFYEDEACTTVWTERKYEKPDQTDDVVYAKYIKGVWDLIRTADDVVNMFANAEVSADKGFYLMNDVDCSSLPASTTVKPFTLFEGKLQGNGYTISNLDVKETGLTTANRALFGDITETALIKNVNFANVTFEYETSRKNGASATNVNTWNKPSIYFAFTSLDANADVQAVTLSGTMRIELGRFSVIENLWAKATTDGALNKDTNFKYGGFATDGVYTGGFTVNTTFADITVEDWR